MVGVMPNHTVMLFFMNELYKQIIEIEKLLNKTQGECLNIVWEKHHPDYPQSLHDLMSYIARSKWIYSEYRKHKIKDVIANAENANIEQVRCAITWLNRSEKWCTGSWVNTMKDRTLEPLIKRGKELTIVNE